MTSGEAALALLPKIRITASLLNSRRPASVSFDDLCSVGFLGAMEAVERYDTAYDCSLKSYSEGRIRGAMLDEIRRVVGRSGSSKAAGTEVSEVEAFRLPCPRPSPFDLREADEIELLLEGLVHALPWRERLILRLWAWDGWLLRDIGVLLGVNESRVSQLKTKALDTLRDLLRKRGLPDFAAVATNCMH
jgi:RNA polymerase sigma factor FliA